MWTYGDGETAFCRSYTLKLLCTITENENERMPDQCSFLASSNILVHLKKSEYHEKGFFLFILFYSKR